MGLVSPNPPMPPQSKKRQEKMQQTQLTGNAKLQDIQKLKELMKKIYQGQPANQYTDEDKMMMEIANVEWVYKDKNYSEHSKHPMAVTLKEYLSSRLAYHRAEPEEAMLLFDLLESEVSPNGENFGISLRKIINAARVILQNKPVLMMDDDALSVPENPTLMDDVFNEMKDTTILSVINDFENL